MKRMNIVLMGARGSGKSTVGAMLAGMLDRPFVELDERTMGAFAERSVKAVWHSHGETAWRKAEAAALRTALAGDNQVVALGGGTPTAPGAQAMIDDVRAAGQAVVVYLCADAATLAERIRRDPGDRPSLTGKPIHEELETTLREREPVYRALADHVMDVAGRSERDVAERIARIVRLAE